MGVSGNRGMLAGTWRAGQLRGQYLFSAGTGDNYLELRLHPRLTPRLQNLHNHVSSAISVRHFGEGFALGVLETLAAREPRAAPAARLAALVTSLQPALPGLEVFASRMWGDETFQSEGLASPPC